MTDGFALKSWVINIINKVSKKNNKYSTDETVIGTWIDGKPLYRKVIKETNYVISKSQNHDIDISTMNIDNISALYGVLYGIGGDGKTPYDCPIGMDLNPPTNRATVYVERFENHKPHVLRIVATDMWNNCLITMEYTKTTDKATITV